MSPPPRTIIGNDEMISSLAKPEKKKERYNMFCPSGDARAKNLLITTAMYWGSGEPP